MKTPELAAPLLGATAQQLSALRDWLAPRRRLFVLTGAGCSTASGIPDYRDRAGQWKRPQPVQYRPFVTEPATRQRYWARSLLGWRWFARARPNPAHRALVELERRGLLHQLVTQNVDRLHQRAGQRRVIDLHGRIDRVVCLDCGARSARTELQRELERANPDYVRLAADWAPDGDADLEGVDFGAFQVPACRACGGLLKPDVVFFGEAVPGERVKAAMQALHTCDGMLVVGSSLMVYSGFRFCRRAAELGLPMAAINRGLTRAEALLQLRLDEDCASALTALMAD